MFDFTVHFNKESGMTLYEQIYEEIKKEILFARLAPGDRLPSKRKLSDFLKVSLNTVENAYEQLIAEGYIESKPKSGFFVCKLDDLVYTPKVSDIDAHTFVEKPKYTYDLNPNYIDTSLFPFESFRKQARHIITPENEQVLSLGNPLGELSLRCEVERYLHFARGVVCTPEQIIIGAGSEIMLQRLMRLFGGDAVYGLESPGYYATYCNLKSLGKDVRLISVDRDGLKIEELEKSDVSVVYVTPSHQFPTGSILSASNRHKLLNWAFQKEERYIIEDDYDGEFRYSGKPVPSLQSMGKDKVIYLGTFSKCLTPSMRMSYMVLPIFLLKRYQEELFYCNCPVSRTLQQMVSEFMKNGEFEKHIHKMRKIYSRKLILVTKLLAPYQKQVKIGARSAGLYLSLKIINGMDEKTLIEKAGEMGIKVYGISEFIPPELPLSTPTIILGFGGILESELSKAISCLLTAWKIS